MANILGRQTVNEKEVIEVDADPSAVAGTVSPAGSLAMWNDAGVGKEFIKVGAADTAWDRVVTYAAGVGIGQGAQLRLAIYDLVGNDYHLDDQVAQNANLIDVNIEPQASRSVALAYRIPNPGDAIAAADFILSEGAQTKNGNMTFNNDVIVQGSLTVNGTLAYLNATNTNITDKLVTLNKGGGAASAGGSGVEFEENAVITGYMKISADRTGYDMLAPAQAFKTNLSLANLTADRVTKFADTSGTILMRPDATPGVVGQVPFFSDANNLISEAALFYAVATNRLGVNTNVPARTLDINGSSLFQGAIRMVTAGLLKANWEQFQAEVATTTAATTTLATIAVPADSELLLKAVITGRRSGGSAGSDGDAAVYERTARFKNVGGVVTRHNLQTDYTSEDQGSWDGTLDFSGTNARVRVAGALNNNIDWTVTYQVMTVA